MEECFAEVVAAALSDAPELDPHAVSALTLNAASEAWPAGYDDGVIHVGVDLDVALELATQWDEPDSDRRHIWVRQMLTAVITREVTHSLFPGPRNEHHQERGDTAVRIFRATPTGATIRETSHIPDQLRRSGWMIEWRSKALRPPARVKRCLNCREGAARPDRSGLCERCRDLRLCDECGRPFPSAEMSANYCKPCGYDRSFGSYP